MIYVSRFMIHGRRGFTLLEVILTVAILTVVMIAGIATFSGFNKTIDMNAVAENIVGHLRRAQIRAMNADDLKRWGIHFDNPTSGNDSYALFSGDSYTTAIETYILPPQIIFTTPATGATVDTLFEKLSGASVNGAQTIVLTLAANANQTITISVNSAGRISY